MQLRIFNIAFCYRAERSLGLFVKLAKELFFFTQTQLMTIRLQFESYLNVLLVRHEGAFRKFCSAITKSLLVQVLAI